MKDMTIDKWLFNYRRVKKEFWITFFACIFILVFIIGLKWEQPASNLSENEETVFDSAITEYEQTTGIKIYPKGRECLKKATTNCKTKEEVLKVIHDNEKWFKK